jgi:hypothetical protein
MGSCINTNKEREKSMSSFDEKKRYYVFKYVVDSVSGEPTNHEGEVQAFVEATDPWDALEVAGFDDVNAYGANRVDDPKVFEDAITEERKLLKKLTSQLKDWKDSDEAAYKEIIEKRECPNGCGKMDEKFRCKECGYGYEAKSIVKELDKMIKDGKKNKLDTSELEKLRDELQKTLE